MAAPKVIQALLAPCCILKEFFLQFGGVPYRQAEIWALLHGFEMAWSWSTGVRMIELGLSDCAMILNGVSEFHPQHGEG